MELNNLSSNFNELSEESLNEIEGGSWKTKVLGIVLDVATEVLFGDPVVVH